VVCIHNAEYPASLELHKIYRALADEEASREGDMRVVDESGDETSEQGEVRVVKAGPELELLAVNPLDDYVMATPAISNGSLFVRSQ
jgi:hypothetical protein